MSGDKLSIYYFSGTHWDREWYQTFQGFRMRLVTMMNELIDVLEQDENFKVFHFDGQTIVLEDFSEIEPMKRERLKKLMRDRRILVGPWYVMPDEFLLSGESLIRNLMLGYRLAKEWGAEPWKYGYVCDIFGHIAQMPQIFNGFGIKHALVGRGTNEHTSPAHFIWRSPDGSECTTFKLKDSSGYGAFCLEALGWQDKKSKDAREVKEKIREYIEHERGRTGIPVVFIMDSMDHERVHPETPWVLEVIKELYPEAEVLHENLETAGVRLDCYRDAMPVKTGELNETGKIKGGYIYLITHTLSSRYPIKRQNDICQTLLEKWVEPMTAIHALQGFDIQKTYTELAYKYLIQNHPHDSICGCSIDQVHRDMEYRFDQSRMLSIQVMDECMNFIKQGYPLHGEGRDRGLVLVNPLPFRREEVVTVDIDFHTDYPCKYQEPFGYEEKNSFKILDFEGREVPYGLVSIKKNYTIRRYNQFAEKADVYSVSFKADMPAMGRAEYKIVPFAGASRYLEVMSRDERRAENEYLRLDISDNGTIHLLDKSTGKEYRNLLSFIDDGEIGDGWFHANPVEDRLVSSAASLCGIEKIENGPSRVVFKITVRMQVPVEMDHHRHGIRRSDEYTELKITSRVGLSKAASHVDIETVIDNRAKDHRVRLKLPTGICGGKYFAGQPFAFVERDAGIKPETQEWKECDVLEKQMNGIVGKRHADGSGLAFVSAFGLHECGVPEDSEGSILVTLFRSFSKTVMTDGEEGGQIQGQLHYKYCLKPLNPSVCHADLARLQDSAAAGIRSFSARMADNWTASGPAGHFELESRDIVLSMLKRPEDGEKNCVIARFCNLSGQKAPASVRCERAIKEVVPVDFNEEELGAATGVEDVWKLALEPWKVQSYRIRFR